MKNTNYYLPKKRSAYQYCVLQYQGNLPENEYELAIAEYENKVQHLKRRIVLENLPDNHFFYQQIKWMEDNRIALLRTTAPYLFVKVEEEDTEKEERENGIEVGYLVVDDLDEVITSEQISKYGKMLDSCLF